MFIVLEIQKQLTNARSLSKLILKLLLKMFDREKQVVIDKYCKAIFKETDVVSVSELLNLKLPESVKHFISREIENRVEQEFEEIKKFSKFNFDHSIVKPLVEELKILLKFTRELKQDELSLLLKLALDLNLDYLLKPCETLTSFVFKYEETQSVAIIKERLKFIIEYEYFPILINEYFNRTGLTKISKNDFVDLLHKIEKEYSRNFTVLDHYHIFSRFKNFLLELNLFINDYPEYEAFIIYLNDKNQTNLAIFLEEHKEHFKISGRSVANYLQTLLQPVSNEFKKEELFVKERESSYTEVNQFTKPVESENKEEFFSYDEQIQDEQLRSIAEQNVETKDSIQLKESSIADESSKKTELVEKLTATTITRKQKVFDRNLDGLMPARLKKKIIKKIFDGNEYLFTDFMSNLNKVENWDEASILLTDLFDKKSIQPFSKWAIKFTEFLYENIK